MPTFLLCSGKCSSPPTPLPFYSLLASLKIVALVLLPGDLVAPSSGLHFTVSAAQTLRGPGDPNAAAHGALLLAPCWVIRAPSPAALPGFAAWHLVGLEVPERHTAPHKTEAQPGPFSRIFLRCQLLFFLPFCQVFSSLYSITLKMTHDIFPPPLSPE